MVANIITELGLEAWPEEKRLKLIEDMSELVEKRTMIRMISALDEADVKQANDLADDPEKLLAFLASKSDFGQILAEETEQLKKELSAAAEAPIDED